MENSLKRAVAFPSLFNYTATITQRESLPCSVPCYCCAEGLHEPQCAYSQRAVPTVSQQDVEFCDDSARSTVEIISNRLKVLLVVYLSLALQQLNSYSRNSLFKQWLVWNNGGFTGIFSALVKITRSRIHYGGGGRHRSSLEKHGHHVNRYMMAHDGVTKRLIMKTHPHIS